jgi:CRP/FNR family transcriptional regulator/CRP/FNR family cyclic AMP-dependent transcriptional regulator
VGILINTHFLKKVQLFAELEESDVARVAEIASEKTHRKNEVIFHENDPGSVLFVLKSGAVKISVCDRNGKEDILKIIYPGDFFGDMSLLDGKHRSATVSAMERSVSLTVQREHFLSLINKHPNLVMNMLATMSRRLRKTDEKIASLRFADSYGKVAKVILDLAEEHGTRVDGKVVVDLNLNRQAFADHAGTTRETATRILNEFQKSGCIMINKRKITIMNESVLRRELF